MLGNIEIILKKYGDGNMIDSIFPEILVISPIGFSLLLWIAFHCESHRFEFEKRQANAFETKSPRKITGFGILFTMHRQYFYLLLLCSVLYLFSGLGILIYFENPMAFEINWGLLSYQSCMVATAWALLITIPFFILSFFRARWIRKLIESDGII